MLPVTITWHGHSCFTLENDGMAVVLDPYDPEMIGYPKLSVDAHAMLASHQHGDHNYRAAVHFLPIASAEPFLQLAAAGYKIDHLDGPSCILDGNLRGHCLVFSFQASERR